MAWRRKIGGKRRSVTRTLGLSRLTHEPLERRNLLAAAPVLGNNPPMLAPIADQTVDQGAVVSFTATAMDDDLPAGSQLTFQLDPDETPAGATIDRLTGAFSWTAPTGATGVFRFVILVSDRPPTGVAGARATSDAEEFTVTVVDTNQPPVNSVPGGQTTNEDTPLVFSAANSNLISIADPDAAAGAVRVTLSVAAGSGTLTLAGVAGLDFDGPNGQGDGKADESMSFTGTVADINTALAGLQFAPALNFNGDTTLTIVTNDQGNTGSDGAKSDTDGVSISVASINDAPVVTLPPGPGAFLEDVNGAISGINIADPDAGSADVQVTFAVSSGRILISDLAPGGVTAGQITGNGTNTVVVTAPLAAINTTLASLSGLDYQGNANFNGDDTLTVTANDNGNSGTGGALSDTEQLTLSVAPVNDAPTVTVPAVAFDANEDQQIFLTGLDVNDIDSGAGNVTVTLTAPNGVLTVSDAVVGGVAAGQITGQSSGNVSLTATLAAIRATLASANGVAYQGAANFFGADTVTLAIDDNGNTGGGNLTDSDQVTVNVASVNDAPVNGLPAAAQSTNEDTPIVFSTANGNAISIGDVDAGISPIQVTLGGTNGTVTLGSLNNLTFTTGDGTGDAIMTFTGTIADINAALQGLSFAPSQNFNGNATLTVATSDQGATGGGGTQTDIDDLTIAVTPVNDAPVVTAPASFSVLINQQFTLNAANNATVSVNDPEGGTGGEIGVLITVANGAITLSGTTGLTFTQGDGNSDAILQFRGTQSNVNAALDGMVYQTENGFTGPTTITVTASDLDTPALVDTEVIAVTVEGALNQAPVNTVPSGAVSATEDDAAGVNIGGISIADPDAGLDDVQVTLAVGSGTITLLDNVVGGATAGQIAANGTGSVVITAPIAAINATLAAAGGVLYRGNLNFNGQDTLTVTTNDLGNNGSGGALSDTDTVTINVAGVNDAPTVAIPDFNATEDVPVAVTAGVGDVDAAAGNVTLTLGVANGTLTLRTDVVGGIIAADVTGNGSGNLTITGSVAAINATLSAADGLLYQTNLNFNGTDTLTADINDNGNAGSGGALSGSDTAAITIAGVNDAPNLVLTPPSATVDQFQLVNMTASATDPENNTVTFQIDPLGSTGPVGSNMDTATIDPNTGAFSFTPNTAGEYSFRILATDNGGPPAASDAEFFTITVNPVNLPPDLDPQTRDTELGSGPVTINPTVVNPEGAAGLTYQIVEVLSQPAGGNADSATMDPDTGVFSFTANTPGVYQFLVSVTDSDLPAPAGDTEIYTINVADTNDAPVVTVPLAGPAILEDGSAFITGLNMTDADAGTAVVQLTLSALNGALIVDGSVVDGVTAAQITGNGTGAVVLQAPLAAIQNTLASATGVQYAPNANFFGADTLTVTGNDLGNTGGTAKTDTETLTLDVTGVNDIPSFTPGAAVTVNEDAGPQSIAWATGMSAGPANESAQTLSFELTNDNAALFDGPVTIGADGALVFTPAANANGVANLSVVLRDSGGTANGGVDASAAVALQITINPVNDAPAFALGANVTAAEDAPAQTVENFVTGVSPGPADEAAQTVSFSVTTDRPELFSAGPAIAADGTLTFTPAANANGTAVLTITGTDTGGTDNGGDNDTVVSTATITITPVNDAPSFTPGADATVSEDSGAQSLAWASAISAGPADESAQTLTFELTNDNAALFDGPVTIAADGTLSFTPAANANGVANLTVLLRDSGGTADGGVDATTAVPLTITVNAVNDAPSIANSGDVTVDEDAPAQSIAWASNLSAGPADEASQTLSFELTNDNAALFDGPVTIAADGTLSFTPAANANGVANLSVVLRDNGGTLDGGVDASAAVALKITVNAVNDPPTAGNDAADVETDSTGATIGVLSNDSANPDGGETLTIIAKTDGTNGTVAIALDGLSVTYTPNPGFTGTDSFTYTINDGTPGSDATATVNVTVGNVNQPPDLAGPPTQSIDEDGEVQFSFGVGNTITVTDPDAAAMPVRLVISVTNGTLTLAPNTLSFATGDGMQDTEIDVSGSQADLNAALEGASFNPTADFSGTAGITILSFDNGNTGIGGEKSDLLQIAITINSVNDPPSASGDAFTVAQDSGEATFNVLGNDTTAPDIGETLAITDVSAGDQGGTITIGDGGANIRYTPAPGFMGTEEFTYTVNDGTIGSDSTATVTVSVQPVNQAPTIGEPLDQTTLEDQPLVFSLAGGNEIAVADADAGAGLIEVSLEAPNGSLTLGSTTGLTLDGFTGADSDGSDGTLTFRGNLVDVNAALQGLTFTPAADFNGATALSIAVDDLGNTGFGGAKSDSATVLIGVTAVNDPPTADLAPTTIDVNEDAGPQTFANLLNIASITPGPANESAQLLNVQPLDITNLSLFSALPEFDGDGTLTFTPAPNANGTAVVTLTLIDDGGTADGGVDTTVKQVTINIVSVNDKPTIASQTVTDAMVSTPVNLPVTAGDVDGDTLSFSVAVQMAPSGSNADSATVDANTGAFSFTPDRAGIYVFRIRATDDGTPVEFRDALYTISVGDVTLPSISADLTNDTGTSDTDGITSDPSVSGTATDDVGVTLFEAAVDASAFSDQTTSLGGGGAFAFTRAQLEAILGAALSDGGHTVHLRATDATGNVRNVTVSMTLDTIAPSLPTFALDDASRFSGMSTVTILEVVGLQGLTSQGAAVGLVGTALLTQADLVTGQFTLPGVAVDLGGNMLTLRATDTAGNFSEFTSTITRQDPPPPAPEANDEALGSLLDEDPFDFPG